MKRLGKFLQMARSEQRLLIDTALLLGAIRLGLCLLPFQTLRRWLARLYPATTQSQAARVSVGRVVWAVKLISRYIPGVKCLARALATEVLLRQHGHPARLRIGVARSEQGQLQAHAWVESQDKVVSGGLRDLWRYTPLPPLEGKRP
jgi:hypothetical protein